MAPSDEWFDIFGESSLLCSGPMEASPGNEYCFAFGSDRNS
jgi:hypothetical protein